MPESPTIVNVDRSTRFVFLVLLRGRQNNTSIQDYEINPAVLSAVSNGMLNHCKFNVISAVFLNDAKVFKSTSTLQSS